MDELIRVLTRLLKALDEDPTSIETLYAMNDAKQVLEKIYNG